MFVASFHAATRIARGMWPDRSYSFTPTHLVPLSAGQSDGTPALGSAAASSWLCHARGQQPNPALHSIPGWAAASVATKA
eukprot:624368-Prymnesium_polylepis.1